MQKDAIGIDLGTSNSSLSVGRHEDGSILALDITQVITEFSVGESKLLPSAIYLPKEPALDALNICLPWHHSPLPYLIGLFARNHGPLVPDQLVTSAKSWLCNPHVDRHKPILPWGSTLESLKCSPVEASTRILKHLRENLACHLHSDETLSKYSVVLTVPASFDEVARNLTYEAALAAGFHEVVLLEEPLAAFYAWIAANADSWRDKVSPQQIVLVVDIGGGTTDFSLILVSESSGKLELHRISVGEHLLLGGDNIDLGLAYHVRHKLEAQGQNIDDWQFLSLVHSVRGAKETLLSDAELTKVSIGIPGRGASLFASTITTELAREEIISLVLDGYFPLTAQSELPQVSTSGLREFGLPYVNDPAFSRHLAKFLLDSLKTIRSNKDIAKLVGHDDSTQELTLIQPDLVLFNGGVCKAEIIRNRILTLLNNWGPKEVKELVGADLEQAVSNGAAFYGSRVRNGSGLKIRAGTARSFYIGIESSMPAVPGIVAPTKGVCVVPQGTEEGSRLLLADRDFGLVTGEKVEFRFFSSKSRGQDQVGDIVSNAAQELNELGLLEATVQAAEKRELIPVQLEVSLTELGTLELWMIEVKSDRRWKLEFNLRPHS